MNISELAEELNLSPTTVSRALSGQGEKYRVSRATVQRVLAAAEKHRVVPDALGAGLQRGRMGMVGLLVPDITNSFFSSLARSIELELRSDGFSVQLCDSAEDPEVEVELIEQIVKRRLDGLILAPVGRLSDRFVEAMTAAPFPVVMVDRILPELDLPLVSLDNAAAGRLAVKHLLDCGHRKIACLRGNRASYTDRERYRGVEEVLLREGLPTGGSLVCGDGYTRQSGIEGARKILGTGDLPEAVICLNGQGILGILEVASELNLDIPGDISVVAFDEQPWSALVSPPLTTIEQPVQEIATRAVELMKDQQGRGRGKSGHTVVEARIRIRESVAHR